MIFFHNVTFLVFVWLCDLKFEKISKAAIVRCWFMKIYQKQNTLKEFNYEHMSDDASNRHVMDCRPLQH